MTKIKIALDEGAIAPTRAHAEDAGLDLYTPFHFVVCSGGSWAVDTGVHIEIPAGYVGLLKSKSGLNVKDGILTEGVIDAGYTGTIRVKVYNHGAKAKVFRAGDKITQLVIVPCVTPEVEIADTIEGGERGNNGFGSTGR